MAKPGKPGFPGLWGVAMVVMDILRVGGWALFHRPFFGSFPQTVALVSLFRAFCGGDLCLQRTDQGLLFPHPDYLDAGRYRQSPCVMALAVPVCSAQVPSPTPFRGQSGIDRQRPPRRVYGRPQRHSGAKAVLIGNDLPSEFAVIQRKSIVTLPEILGYFGTAQSTTFARLGSVDDSLEQLPSLFRTETISDLYCSASLFKGNDFQNLSRMAAEHFVNLHLVPDQREIPLGRIEIDYLGHIPVWSLRPFPLETKNAQTLKRLMDVLISSMVVVGILTWLIPLMALWIRLDSRGPVFFVQRRSGKDNRPFRCYKFRTMRVNAEADLVQASANDARITRIGTFLRKSSLDELPQFFNVLRGDMSVVGPRPHMLSHTESYSQVIERFMARHRVKPGITGLSQALGYRGETRAKQDMKNRVRIDLLYIQNWSPLLDLKIIGMTALSLLRSLRGAAMEPIDGPSEADKGPRIPQV
ncbi:MAG: exopolysaccharide biosynthesis polyprenyl glycosylphosphotransferase [Cytophagia bacterium]|nr:exopolysaccharide biosynthesis polyprenyl glycosylphosphotransferase [Cytophagia bacterium]